MLTFIVMPCLNEVGYIEHAVRSLLLPEHHNPPDVHLIVVDNGSTDGTLVNLDHIADRYPRRITIGHQARRGYVPPRRTGVKIATSIAAARGKAPSDVLILQADADTQYRGGYVTAMQSAANASGVGVLFEGATRRPVDFATEHPGYVAAERLIDDALEWLEAEDEDDVVLDDKVCAYRLSDYERWGGLLEEIDSAGDQVHAETTRMFIRARLALGARKMRVNLAGAVPSRRKVAEDPYLHFATMGFPRGRSWNARLKQGYAPSDIDHFAEDILQGREAGAIRLRRAHLLALFRYLPAAVSALGGQGRCQFSSARDVQAALDAMPRRTKAQIIAAPALLIEDALQLIDTHPELFEESHYG